MARYVDGFVIPVPNEKLDAYLDMARRSSDVWRDHGALEFKECVAEDLETKEVASFPGTVSVEDGETVVFSWIVFESRAERDRINGEVMKDSRLKEMMEGEPMPFDAKRMVYGGFEIAVDA